VSARFFHIAGGGQSVVFATTHDQVPELIYWGDGLAEIDWTNWSIPQRAVPHGMLDDGEKLDLFPEAGRGFSGFPALSYSGSGRDPVSQCVLVGTRAETANAIIFALADGKSGIEATLSFSIDAETGILSAQTTLTNTGALPLNVEWCAAITLPCAYDEFLQFSGRWTGEFQTDRVNLKNGQLVVENRTGRTSHHAPPFLVTGSHSFGEHQGSVIGLHLAWSGNHRLQAERLRDGRVVLQAGELLLPGEVSLADGETYQSPMAYLARSDSGLNGLSTRFHPFVRDSILDQKHRNKPRPVHFNTWEAVYFDHKKEKLEDLIREAATIGIERFVLDDGWFKGRNDDTAGLGDWSPDQVKYPHGLGPLINAVNAAGMEFGLWVEPEMANANSDLLRAHPDWILGVAGRKQPLGRGQYVLDLTRKDVCEYIFAALDKLLRDHPIAYLKWDMNRDLVHGISGNAHAVHAQTNAVYALIDRLRLAHPTVEIESCASGGGRADFEILKRTDRIWTSDCNDPLDRQIIQRGFSLFMPPRIMGAHVGPRRSHTTGREASLDVRALTAFFGHFGVEGDLTAFSEVEKNQLAGWIALHKRHRALIHSGQLIRLEHADPNLIAFAVTGASTLISVVQTDTPRFPAPASLPLTGVPMPDLCRVTLLNPSQHPQREMKQIPPFVRGEPTTMPGALLRNSGLPLPVLRVGDGALFHLEPDHD
jgi:alpha-galactosidase